MTDDKQSDLLRLLEKVVENQTLQISQQAEAMELQRKQIQNAEGLIARTEKVQGKSFKLIRFLFWALIFFLALYLLIAARR